MRKIILKKYYLLSQFSPEFCLQKLVLPILSKKKPRIFFQQFDPGGELSHEYHFPANIGQDKLLICTDCGHGLSSELLEGKKEDERKCAACGSEAVAESKGIEVGHTFLLGQKYSKALDASYTGPQGKPVLLEMGCYGLGLSRIMAAAIEVLSSEEGGLRWPDKIVPFSVAVLAPKVKRIIKINKKISAIIPFFSAILCYVNFSYRMGAKKLLP